MEIARAIGWDELYELSEPDLNALCDGWENGRITADTLVIRRNSHPPRP
jgi:hypothetical protein